MLRASPNKTSRWVVPLPEVAILPLVDALLKAISSWSAALDALEADGFLAERAFGAAGRELRLDREALSDFGGCLIAAARFEVRRRLAFDGDDSASGSFEDLSVIVLPSVSNGNGSEIRSGDL